MYYFANLIKLYDSDLPKKTSQNTISDEKYPRYNEKGQAITYSRHLYF